MPGSTFAIDPLADTLSAMRRRQRRGARWVLALGLAASGVLALGAWRELAALYHLLRLRRDPAHLAAIIAEPEGTAARAAVVRFAASPEGRAALVGGWYTELKGVLEFEYRFIIADPECSRWLWLWFDGETLHDQACTAFEGGGGFIERGARELSGDRAGRLRGYHEALIESGCDRVPLPHHHDLVLSIARREDAYFPPWEGCRQALRIERAGDALPLLPRNERN